MSLRVNAFDNFGNTPMSYMATVWYLSFPENPLDSSDVHPRPLLTDPKGARTHEWAR
jgi:hypothetical protein